MFLKKMQECIFSSLVLVWYFIGSLCYLLLFICIIGLVCVAGILFCIIGLPFIYVTDLPYRMALKKYEMESRIISLLRMAKMRPKYPAGWLTMVEIVRDISSDGSLSTRVYVDCANIVKKLVEVGVVEACVVPRECIELPIKRTHKLAYRIIKNSYHPRKPHAKKGVREEPLEEHVRVRV